MPIWPRVADRSDRSRGYSVVLSSPLPRAAPARPPLRARGVVSPRTSLCGVVRAKKLSALATLLLPVLRPAQLRACVALAAARACVMSIVTRRAARRNFVRTQKRKKSPLEQCRLGL
mmetsp:Transcript_3644/g.11000  ORF Transcript_3644/g.11000 Transcript_3644/m.11000 type:complete len:117 (-) Transcript_3644:57-407(-)